MRIMHREDQEQREHGMLSPDAAFSDESEGRDRSTEPDILRNDYQRDRDKILHTKSFRRLSHKTQVFLAAEGDHFRTRLTHTLEVAQIARTIARALGLNEDLTEAISLGHDLGHTPFGHAGEAALSDMMGTPFHHNEQSLRVVDKLERDGDGLNLTYEVRMAILGHTGPRIPETLEGRSCVHPTALRTSTTTSTMRSARGFCPKATFRGISRTFWARRTRRASIPRWRT